MRKLLVLPLALSLAALTGCATMGPDYGYGTGGYYPEQSTARLYGTVSSVRPVQMSGSTTSGPGIGAIAGAVIGGAVAHEVTNDRSDGVQTAATIGGAVAGGYIGNRIQQNANGGGTGWGQEVQVRLDNGQYVTLVQPGSSIYSGARVYVSGYGSNARAYIVR